MHILNISDRQKLNDIIVKYRKYMRVVLIPCNCSCNCKTPIDWNKRQNTQTI